MALVHNGTGWQVVDKGESEAELHADEREMWHRKAERGDNDFAKHMARQRDIENSSEEHRTAYRQRTGL